MRWIGLMGAALALCGCEQCFTKQPMRVDRGTQPGRTLVPDAARRPDRGPPPAPAPAGTVGKARTFNLPCEPPMLVGAGDLDGKAGPEVVVACDDTLLVLDATGKVLARTAAEGWPQVLLVADLSGSGRAEALVGWGTSRKRRDAPARLLRYRLQGRRLAGKVVLQPETSRNQFSDIALERSGKDGSVLLAHFVSKYMVRHVRLLPGGKTEEIGTWRMAMSLAPADVPARGAVLVGRLYGDKLGLDGDAFVFHGGKQLPIPTTRGVRAVAAADLDGDNKNELLICDGWAQRYAAEGKALLTAARPVGRRFQTRKVLEIPGEFTIDEVQVVDVDGDKKPEILARGSASLRLYNKSGATWTGRVLQRGVSDAVAVDLDRDGRHEVVVVGQKPAIIDLKGALE